MAFLNFLLSPCYKSGGHFRPLAYNIVYVGHAIQVIEKQIKTT